MERYRKPQTGPKTHPGGVQVGFARFAYQSPGWNWEPNAATLNVSTIQNANPSMSNNRSLVIFISGSDCPSVSGIAITCLYKTFAGTGMFLNCVTLDQNDRVITDEESQAKSTKLVEGGIEPYIRIVGQRLTPYFVQHVTAPDAFFLSIVPSR